MAGDETGGQRKQSQGAHRLSAQGSLATHQKTPGRRDSALKGLQKKLLRNSLHVSQLPTAYKTQTNLDHCRSCLSVPTTSLKWEEDFRGWNPYCGWGPSSSGGCCWDTHEVSHLPPWLGSKNTLIVSKEVLNLILIWDLPVFITLLILSSKELF